MGEKEFAEYIRDNIKDMLPAEEYGAFTEVQIRNIQKSGGNELMVLNFLKPGERISPCVDLEVYYDAYRRGAPLETVMEDIIIMDRRVRENILAPNMGIEDLSFEAVRDRIYIQACGTKESRAYLEKRPHTEMGDLSATYHILIGESETDSQSMEVTNSLFDSWKISKDELHMTAISNMTEYNQAQMCGITDVLSGKETNILERREGVKPGEDMMYVLTNKKKIHGAAFVFDMDVMEKATAKLGESCFVLPSSKHEVLLMPESNAPSYRELCSMVYDINRNEVAARDFLSDKVQFYDRNAKKLLGQKEYMEYQERRLAQEKRWKKEHKPPRM